MESNMLVYRYCTSQSSTSFMGVFADTKVLTGLVSVGLRCPICYSRTCTCRAFSNARNRNRHLQISKAPLKNKRWGTSLFTRAASNERGGPKYSPCEAQVRLPKGERRQIRR